MMTLNPPVDWSQIRHRLLRKVEDDAARIISLFKLDDNPRTPDGLIYKLFGDKVGVDYAPLHEGVDGFTIPLKGKWVITINPRHSQGRQRYTLFHELWHAYVGESGFSADEPQWIRKFREERANVFAAYILMRPGWVRKYWRKFRLEDKSYREIVRKMVVIFDVSRESIIHRLRFLNCITEKEAQYLLESF